MATAKKTQIVITANAAVAKKVMDELQQRIANYLVDFYGYEGEVKLINTFEEASSIKIM
jgi:hypothetical protein